MRFEIIGKNIKVTSAMEKQIEKKLSTLSKYVQLEEDTVARVVTRVYPNGQKIEVTIPTKFGILRTEVTNDDLYAAVDIAVDKLSDQSRRQKTRLSRKHRESLAESFLEESENGAEEDIPVRTKSIKADRMDLDEAIMQMELSSHDFYVYTDEESRKIAIVYKRNGGGYGLLETE